MAQRLHCQSCQCVPADRRQHRTRPLVATVCTDSIAIVALFGAVQEIGKVLPDGGHTCFTNSARIRCMAPNAMTLRIPYTCSFELHPELGTRKRAKKADGDV